MQYMVTKSLSFTLLLILCLYVQVSLQAKDPQKKLPQAVIDEMASRRSRYHHLLWHNVRDNWNFFSPQAKKQLTKLGWNAPRPTRTLDENGNLIAITDNDCGEDFLYMHRKMIERVNQILCDIKDTTYGLVKGWETIPAPGDKNWPVPAAYDIPGTGMSGVINMTKTMEFYLENVKPMEETCKDPEQLQSMTLGEFGSLIENTIHNWLHLIFSAESKRGYRPSSSSAIPKVEKKWDHPKYIWLADTYASHVNPVFWKLHGWVDDRIKDWQAANGVDEIQWKGTWTGGPMDAIKAANKAGGNGDLVTDGEPDADYLDEVMSILATEKVKESGFTDAVKIAIKPKKKKKNLRR